MYQNAIEARSLSKLYRGVPAVDALSFSARQGEVFGLLGPNGAGKTTTIMMLLGAVKPTSGSGVVLGSAIGSVKARRHIGFLPERFQFQDFLTAREFLDLHGKLCGVSSRARRQRIPLTLERVGLADRADDRIGSFSKGMQQRIGLAQAILHDPDLVILDEPTSALDPLGRRDVRDLVSDLRADGKTVVLNSHLLSEIEATCDRIAIMKRGKIVLTGAMDELLESSAVVEVEVEGLNDAALEGVRRVARKLRLERVPIRKFTVWLDRAEDAAEIASAIVNSGSRLMALTPRRETLEQLFVRTIEGE